MAVDELPAMPALGPLYRSAVLRRGAAGDAVPDTELQVRGVRIDLAHLAEYDRVCGFRLRDELPPTYPHVLAFPLAMTLMSQPSFPLPLLGLVHVANRIEQLRPVEAREPLTIRVRAANLRPHAHGRQVDIVASAWVSDQDEVWRCRSTYLHRTSTAAAASGAKDAPHETPQDPPAPTARWAVDRSVGPDYAAVSGDRNPIHTSRLLARAFGFARPIAHGMWSKARCLAALEGRLPDAYAVDVAFKLPIPLPARVGFTARRDGPMWHFALHDAGSTRPHLTGTLTP